MRLLARRSSYSLCVTVRDWVPAQLLTWDNPEPVVTFVDGPCCLVQWS